MVYFIFLLVFNFVTNYGGYLLLKTNQVAHVLNNGVLLTYKYHIHLITLHLQE
jgi:hypothetical protein